MLKEMIDTGIEKIGNATFIKIKEYGSAFQENHRVAEKSDWNYIIGINNESWELDNSDVTLNLMENFSVVIPRKLLENNNLKEEIETAAELRFLKQNWDGEGSKGYKLKTIKNAINFVIEYTKWIWEERNHCIPTPNIFPGVNGTVDVYWKSNNYDLIINIPEAPNTVASFYGDNMDSKKIQGTFSIEEKGPGILLELLSIA
jgi:hypothetical protein